MKIITTVGTSILTNFEHKDVQEKLGASINEDIKSIEKNSKSATDYGNRAIKENVSVIFTKISEHWFTGWLRDENGGWKQKGSEPNEDASAEIKSIFKIIEEAKIKEAEVHLLASDTVLSLISAKLIQYGLEEVYSNSNRKITVSTVKEVKLLGVKNQKDFDQGFMRLIEEVDTIVSGDLANSILNITGGYKGIIPVISLYAQLKGLSTKYLYDEASSQLITIGNLPINFDWGLVHEFYPVYTDFEKIERTKQNAQKVEKAVKLGLLRGETNLTYTRTYLGKLLNSFAFDKTPESVKVIGLYMEYKLAEYFLKTKEYSEVLRDDKLGTELPYDIVLKKENYLKIIEVKTAAQVYTAFDEKYDSKGKKIKNLSEQMSNQLKVLTNSGQLPNVYEILFYFNVDSYPENSPARDKLQSNMRRLKDIVSTFQNGIVFSASFIELNLTFDKSSKDGNPVQSLLSKTLNIKSFIF